MIQYNKDNTMAYIQISEKIKSNLSLSSNPIAISFTDDLPSGIKDYSQNNPAVAAGCMFWQAALTEPFATTAKDHSGCAVGLYTHNMGFDVNAEKDLNDSLDVFSALNYVKPDDVSKIATMQKKYKYVVYAPLHLALLPIDVVLLFAAPSQSLILTEAAAMVDGKSPPAMGRPACGVVPEVINSGSAAFSLGCCGAKAYVNTFGSEVMLFGMPGDKIEAYANAIETFSKANKTLTTFHQIRKKSFEEGETPSVQDSLNAMSH
jgi:uncharacterized protein (DUF169 family)